jgi:transposase
MTKETTHPETEEQQEDAQPKKMHRAETPKANEKIAEELDELVRYELKEGNRFKAYADTRAADAIRHYAPEITSAEQVAHLEGVGKGTVEKVEQFLEHGHMDKLEDFHHAKGELAGSEKDIVLAAATEGRTERGEKRDPDEPTPHPVTSAQRAAMKKAEQQYSKMTTAELHDLLQKNNGKVAGNKAERVKRCAQGKVLGSFPSCPDCEFGKPDLNQRTGFYTCKGWMDGTKTYHPCFFKGPLKRGVWKE